MNENEVGNVDIGENANGFNSIVLMGGMVFGGEIDHYIDQTMNTMTSSLLHFFHMDGRIS